MSVPIQTLNQLETEEKIKERKEEDESDKQIVRCMYIGCDREYDITDIDEHHRICLYRFENLALLKQNMQCICVKCDEVLPISEKLDHDKNICLGRLVYCGHQFCKKQVPAYELEKHMQDYKWHYGIVCEKLIEKNRENVFEVFRQKRYYF